MTRERGAGAFFSAFLLLCVATLPVCAEEADESVVASGIYLAYVETGDQDTDQVSYDGLSQLGQVINARTTIKVKGVQAVDPAQDALHYYPFLYWPMVEGQQALSATATRNLQDYMGEGGLIVFDTRDGQFDDTGTPGPGTRKLRELTKDMQIPTIAPLGDGDIMTKSFYLLDDFPGRFNAGKLWVEKDPNQNHDAVTSVIIGGGDWAAAWSANERDRARFDVAGGEDGREMAYRFGVNLAMTALAGNYKSDQVHVPYILERLEKP